MQTLDFRISRRKKYFFSDSPEKLARHHSWIAVGVAVVGAGTSMYGANKQAKANQASISANNENQTEQNRLAWANYLMTRGINPQGAQTGVIPNNPQAINSRLPLWATMKRAVPAGTPTTTRTVGGGAGLATGVNNGQLVYGNATGGGSIGYPNYRGGMSGGGPGQGRAFPDITSYNPMKGSGRQREEFL